MVTRSAAEVDDEAASWVARYDRGLSADEKIELNVWLDADARHLGAYGRMRAVLAYTGKASVLDPGQCVEVEPPAGVSRRRWLQGAAAIVVTGSIGGGSLLLRRSAQRYSTALGEQRVIALADGSVTTLNTASTILVDYGRDVRNVTVLAGEALFDVAKDASRPFIVTAKDLRVRAVGTSFTVSNLTSEAPQVVVQEGVVEAHPASLLSGTGIRLRENMRAVMSHGGTLSTTILSADDVQRGLEWREGRIVFEGSSLPDAARRFARYSAVRVVIDGADLRKEEISGSYQANDPVGFAKAVALALNARVDVAADQVILSR